jgi:predicted metal-dependent HD superfamily phosphohydrolase
MVSMTRKDVRLGIVTRLQASTISPLDTATIYDSRATPVQDTETNVVIVSTWSERQEQFADGQPNFRIITTVLIEGHVTADVNPSDPVDEADLSAELDDLDEAITRTLFEDPTWVQEYEKFIRNERRSVIEPSLSVSRGKVQIMLELQYSRIYEPDAAYYSNLEGFDVTTRIIDDATGDPVPDALKKEQTIDLPTLP